MRYEKLVKIGIPEMPKTYHIKKESDILKI